MHRAMTAFVGTNSLRNSRGIYQVEIDADSGRLRVAQAFPAYNTGYLTLSADRRFLFALSEGMTFQGKARGGVMSFRIVPEGIVPVSAFPAEGQRPCHVCCQGNKLYVACFFGGTISRYTFTDDGIILPAEAVAQEPDSGPRPWERAGMHCAGVTPDGRYAVGLDTGSHAICLYDNTQADFSRVYKKPIEASLRHLVFRSDGMAYVLAQNTSEVFCLRYCPGEKELFQEVGRVSAMPPGFPGKADAAAIRLSPDERMLLVSNRGMLSNPKPDFITWLHIANNGIPEVGGFADTPGRTPRDCNFTPDGRFVLAALQVDNSLALYAVEAGGLRLVDVCREVPSPACIAI